jgi:hypothetical protein
MDPLLPLPARCPFWTSRVTLVRVTSADAAFSNRVADKRAALAAYAPGVRLFAAWTGAYSTDLFEVTREDAARLLAEKGPARG